MSDLLDDWVWSPDAAHWDPVLIDRAEERIPSGIDCYWAPTRDWSFRQRYMLGIAANPEVGQWQMCNTHAFEDAMRGVIEDTSRVVAAYERLRLNGVVPTVEAVDETLPSGPPTDVRGRLLWLRQHRNTGPERPPVWVSHSH
jgi:hypothetical protein